MDEQTTLQVLSSFLNLNDAQQQQLHTAFDATIKIAAPIATQLASNKEAVYEAVKAGISDDRIKTLIGQEASLESQMLTLQAQTFAKMWTILNSDQKAQVDPSMYNDIGEFLSNAKEPGSPEPLTGPNPGGPRKTLPAR